MQLPNKRFQVQINYLNIRIRNREIYPSIEEFAKDVIQAYRDAVKAFYDAGCRYLQLDDVYIAGLSSPEYNLTDSEYSKRTIN